MGFGQIWFKSAFLQVPVSVQVLYLVPLGALLKGFLVQPVMDGGLPGLGLEGRLELPGRAAQRSSRPRLLPRLFLEVPVGGRPTDDLPGEGLQQPNRGTGLRIGLSRAEHLSRAEGSPGLPSLFN